METAGTLGVLLVLLLLETEPSAKGSNEGGWIGEWMDEERATGAVDSNFHSSLPHFSLRLRICFVLRLEINCVPSRRRRLSRQSPLTNIGRSNPMRSMPLCFTKVPVD